MRAVYGVHETNWMCAWPPLMDWCRAQGIDPAVAYRITLAPDSPEAIVDEYVDDVDGKPVMCCGNSHRATRRRTVRISSLPPDKRS